MEVPIVGVPYEITVVDQIEGYPKTEIVSGEYRPGERRIYMRRGLQADEFRRVLLHEMLHGIDDELALGLSHAQVQRLAVGLALSGVTVAGVC